MKGILGKAMSDFHEAKQRIFFARLAPSESGLNDVRQGGFQSPNHGKGYPRLGKLAMLENHRSRCIDFKFIKDDGKVQFTATGTPQSEKQWGLVISRTGRSETGYK